MTDATLLMMEETRGDEGATARLVALARAGDRQAFDRLMLAHQRKVAGLAMKILGNREDALDAAQESFLRVYRHLNKYDQSRNFDAWLCGIVVNVCRDHARKRAGRNAVPIDEIAEPPGPGDTESDAILRQQQALVMRALETLTEKERKAIVLRDMEGLDTEEVAGILGSSPSTVRSQICSARSKIRAFRDRITERRGK